MNTITKKKYIRILKSTNKFVQGQIGIILADTNIDTNRLRIELKSTGEILYPIKNDTIEISEEEFKNN